MAQSKKAARVGKVVKPVKGWGILRAQDNRLVGFTKNRDTAKNWNIRMGYSAFPALVVPASGYTVTKRRGRK